MCRFFVPLQHTAQLGLAVLFETVLISSEFLLDLNLGERLNDVAHLDVAPVDERDTALCSCTRLLVMSRASCSVSMMWNVSLAVGAPLSPRMMAGSAGPAWSMRWLRSLNMALMRP